MTAPLATTVTFLEMHAQPVLHVPPPPFRNHALLRAETPSVPFYRYLYHMVGRDYHWVHRKRMPDAALAALLADPQIEIYVAYVGGVPAGYFELDFREMPTVELSYFGIIGEFVGKGLGRFLLAQAIDTVWQRSPERLHVQTCTLDHPRALPLYQQMGFIPFAQEEAEIVPLDDWGMVRLGRSD